MLPNRFKPLFTLAAMILFIAGAAVAYGVLRPEAGGAGAALAGPGLREGTAAVSQAGAATEAGAPAETERRSQATAGAGSREQAEEEAGEPSQAEDAGEQPPAEEEPAEQSPAAETPEPPEPVLAADFLVYDSDGNEVRLSDLRGRPVVINFWASWCPPCIGEMPEFHDVWQERQADIDFMMIDLTDGQRETEETGKQYILDNGYTFPVYYDLDRNAAETYGIYSIPTTFFIDGEGNFVAYASGAIDRATLEKGIGMTLNAAASR